MVLDPKEHEKNQGKYLLALLADLEAKEAEHSNEPVVSMLREAEIVDKSGLNATLVERITGELVTSKLIQCIGIGGSPVIPCYSLSPTGRLAAEKLSFDKTPLGKSRKRSEWLKSKLTTESASFGVKQFIGWIVAPVLGIGGLIATWWWNLLQLVMDWFR